MNFEKEIINTASHYEIDEEDFIRYVEKNFKSALKELAKDYAEEKRFDDENGIGMCIECGELNEHDKLCSRKKEN
jgi:hypothetical protein